MRMRVPLNSSSEYFCRYSQKARLLPSAVLVVKGSSKTLDLMKRPAWQVGTVHTTSAMSSLAWSKSCGGVSPSCMAG